MEAIWSKTALSLIRGLTPDQAEPQNPTCGLKPKHDTQLIRAATCPTNGATSVVHLREVVASCLRAGAMALVDPFVKGLKGRTGRSDVR